MIEVKCGTILVAHPQLPDADFRHAVILIMRHEREGTFGFNVAVKPLEGTCLHRSGPLELHTPLRLHKNDVSATASEVIDDTGYSFCAVHSLAECLETREGTMVLVGYAGWGQGQLAWEMAAGAWIPTTTSLEAILTAQPEERWKIAAAGAGITVGD